MQSQDNETSGNSFIDENHENLLDHMEAVTNLLRDDWDVDVFNSRIRDFIVDLEDHFSHEEIVLKGAKFEGLDSHSDKHREISMRLRMESVNRLDYDDAVHFLAKARSRILRHVQIEDREYWPVFEPKNSDTALLISWSRELETGDLETDRQHKVFINCINRFHQKFATSSDFDYASKDLRALREYSEYHFSEEERILRERLGPGHMANHENLLADLDVLINEVKAGKYKLKNVGDYLKYWLLNHVQIFDIRDFAGNS